MTFSRDGSYGFQGPLQIAIGGGIYKGNWAFDYSNESGTADVLKVRMKFPKKEIHDFKYDFATRSWLSYYSNDDAEWKIDVLVEHEAKDLDCLNGGDMSTDSKNINKFLKFMPDEKHFQIENISMYNGLMFKDDNIQIGSLNGAKIYVGYIDFEEIQKEQADLSIVEYL